MMCTLKNDGATQQSIARVRVGQLQLGSGVDTNDGIFGNCQFTVALQESADPQRAGYCPVHAIHRRGNRRSCCRRGRGIGCGMCSPPARGTCPTSTPRPAHRPSAFPGGRCAEQCPNGAIKFIDWGGYCPEGHRRGRGFHGHHRRGLNDREKDHYVRTRFLTRRSFLVGSAGWLGREGRRGPCELVGLRRSRC